MSKVINKRKKQKRIAYLSMNIWWQEKDGTIHLATKEVRGFHTWVSNRPSTSKHPRFHHSLFRLLTRALAQKGAKHPMILRGGAIR